MDILLTGSNGFLGKFLLNELSQFGNIYTLNRSNSTYNYNLGDSIIDFDKKFDIVIHSAGKAHSILDTEADINSFFKINVKGTSYLWKVLQSSFIPKFFLFISSVSVYGLFQGEDITEYCELDAKDPYGKSKIEAENIIINWCKEHKVVCTILRLPLVLGANPPGNLGSMINAIRKGYYFNISRGIAKKSMVLASDIAKYILKVSEVGGTYNITDGCHPSFGDLSSCITKQLGKKYVPNMPMFMAYILAIIGDKIGPKFPINSNKLTKITSTLTFNDSKARDAFGWDPTPVLKGFKFND